MSERAGPDHAAASRERLRRAAAGQLRLLCEALSRSPVGPAAAALRLRLAEAEGRLDALSPAGYLRLQRELSALSRGLLRAEAEQQADELRGRAVLNEAIGLLSGLAPELFRPAARLCAGVPVDPGMPERLPALLSLLRARLEIVPRLAAARPAWRR